MPFNRSMEAAGRRRRGSPLAAFLRAPEKDESEVRWLMSYSDFMMQLVCLFILLYSVSSVDTSKAVSLAQAWRDETGVGEVRLPSTGRKPNVPLTSEDLPATIHEVQIMAGRHPAGGSLRIVRSLEGFRLRLSYAMFEKNSDRLDAGGIQAADLIAALLQPIQDRLASVEIVGHASADEDRAEDLSLARAAAVHRRLTRAEAPVRLGAQPLRAVGRAANEPAANNSEEAGRALNRRIEVDVRMKLGR
jgi:chemotaxis protein MotB